MERIVDLDAAATEIEQRRPDWLAIGLQAGPTTWRESAATSSWPYPIVPDRDRVIDPDSVGVVIKAGDHGFIEIVLFRGGWADLTVAAHDDDRGPQLDAPEINTPEAFGLALDDAIADLRSRLR